ncbi:MAG: biopolymer transporter ExbD [Acidobacteriota bacterium]
MRLAERIEQRKHIDAPAADINVTPLVDVVLVLLIIFMVITPMLNDDVQLPKAHFHKRTPKESNEKITLVLGRDKKIRIDTGGGDTASKEAIPADELKEALKQRYQKREDKSMFLKADESLPWGEVLKVMDVARDGTVEEVQLVTDDYPEEKGKE